jgi:hypothetical protein
MGTARGQADKAKLFLTHRVYYALSGATDLKTAVLLSYKLMINYSGKQPTAGWDTAAEHCTASCTSVHEKPNFHIIPTQVPG